MELQGTQAGEILLIGAVALASLFVPLGITNVIDTVISIALLLVIFEQLRKANQIHREEIAVLKESLRKRNSA